MRLSLGVGWMVLIAAEMLAQNPGLGKFVWDEFQNGSSESLSRIMVAVFTIGIIGFLLDRVMLALQSAFTLRRRRDDAILELRNVCEELRRHATCSRDINLVDRGGRVRRAGRLLRLGKTTLMSILAGLITPDAGEVLLRGEPARRRGSGSRRGVPELFADAVAHGVRATSRWRSMRCSRSESKRRAPRAHGEIRAHGRARPRRRTGGPRSCPAACASASPWRARWRSNPEFLLLDEPLSALDALTRAKLQDEIEAIWREEKKTVVLVTNDVDEALLLADRIIPLTPVRAPRSGREFRVNLPRPRDRKAVNHDPQYRQLRAAITQYLLDVEAGKAAPRPKARVKLPDVVPITSADFLPKAVRAANKPKPLSNPDKYVEFYNVHKVYPTPKGPLTVVEGFDLDIKRGECVSLIGHSGCGKSTVLSMCAGLTDVSDGGITLDGREVTSAGPDRGVVFQAPNLLSWLTARAERGARRRPRLSARQRRRTLRHRRLLPRRASGSPTRSTSSRATCRTACGSASASRAPSRCRPSCCCSTSRSACSTR